MKTITDQNAEKILREVGLQIGSWGQVQSIKGNISGNVFWQKYCSPKDAQELCNFSQHVAGWLPEGNWKIVRIDNSTSIDLIQSITITRLLAQENSLGTQLSCQNLFLQFGQDKKKNYSNELLVADLIFMFLIWEIHAQFVSSNNNSADYLSLQDGFVYFCSDTPGRAQVNPVEIFEKNKSRAPDWILKILEEY